MQSCKEENRKSEKWKNYRKEKRNNQSESEDYIAEWIEKDIEYKDCCEITSKA